MKWKRIWSHNAKSKDTNMPVLRRKNCQCLRHTLPYNLVYVILQSKCIWPWILKTMIKCLFCFELLFSFGSTKNKRYIFWYLQVVYIYTERKKKHRVNVIPKFHSSLKKFVKYFTMITKRYMYGTKVPNFIGLWSTSLELLKFIGSYPPNLEIKIKLKINIGCVPLLLPLLP